MTKATHIFVLLVVLGLVWMQAENKYTIKKLETKIEEIKEDCVVFSDVENPILIIGIPEEEK